MTDTLITRIVTSQWAILVAVATVLIVLAEAGFRFGIAARRKNVKVAEGHSGSVQGAILGLLGLLLGFSFAMAVGRYDTRRSLAVDEANSIGTTWLRASFLSDAHHKEAKELLQEYTHLRLEAAKIPDDEAGLRHLFNRSNEIQSRLWQIADTEVAASPGPVSMSFVTTLNETIDLQTSRRAAGQNRVPTAVWLLLIIVAGCGAWASGYGAGTGGHRSIFNQIVFPLLIGVVITLIADIDRSRKGLVSVSQEPLRELYESMQPAPAP
jgi:hypothetical protein